MAKQEMKIRAGAVDYGRIYEQRIAAHLAIKSALDPEISDFWIVSNIDGVEAFDDIVLMLKDREGKKKLYCIQLKHLENKTMQARDLETKGSKFSLKKYQDSYDVINSNIVNKKIDMFKDISMDQIYLILWTNAPLTGREKVKCIHLENVEGMDFLNTSPNSDIVKLHNLPSSESPYADKFFERFYLFARQASATSMDRIIKQKLSSHFTDVSNSVMITIIDYFAKWSMGDSRSIKQITKSDVQLKLLEFLLLPHIMEPTNIKDVEIANFDLINDTLTSFNIIPIESNAFRVLSNIYSSNKLVLTRLCQTRLDQPWNTDLSGTQWEALKKIQGQHNQKFIKAVSEKKTSVPHVTVRDLYFAAWQCRLIPLIVNCNTSKNFIENVIVELSNVTKELSLVLLDPVSSTFNGHQLKIFNTINDLENPELKDRYLELALISLQGKKPIKLETYKEYFDVLNGVTPAVYLILLEGVTEIGVKVDVENYYVQRDLRRPLIQLSVLEENGIIKNRESMFNQTGDLFILTEYDGNLPAKYRRYSEDLTKYIQTEAYKEDEKTFILLTHFTDRLPELLLVVELLHRETNKAVHLLKLKANSLEWSFSKGSVEVLQKHLVVTNLLKNENSEDNVPENDILKHGSSKVTIISNNAGMGKTFMLRSIANKFEPDQWVSYVNLSEHMAQVPKDCNPQAFIQYLSQYTMKNCELCMLHFWAKVYLHCFKTRKIVFLFDGYDEVPSDHTMSILNEVKNFSFKMWVSTRPMYKKALEIQMESLSVEITHFSTEDHVLFLWKYFRSNHHLYKYDDEQIQYIINTINKCSCNLDKTFIALPLQTRMFAEIFGNDITQVSEKEKLTVVDLYNKFVDVKLKEYKSYEATSLKKTLAKLALKLFFTEEQLEDLLDFEDLAEEAVAFRDSYRKDSIVIGLNDKGDAVFGHQTFAEFLAAYWIAKHITNRKGGYNLLWLPLIEKLYYIDMTPVRVFFDRILSQNLLLHIAVLNNDTERVQNLLKAEQVKNELDVLGRSALHVAVTYGKYYDLYIAKEVKGLRNRGLHSVVTKSSNGYRLRIPVSEEKQHRISDEIVETLINSGFENNTDKFFGYDLFDFAMKSCSLNFVHILFKWYEKLTLHFEIGFSFEIFLCCIVHDNLYNILSRRKVYYFDLILDSHNELRDIFQNYNSKLLTLKYNDMYLTELAALAGATEVLFDLLSSGLLTVKDGNLLHKACFNGHRKVVEVLYKMGADIEKADDSNWNPLHQAAVRRREDIVYHLLRSINSKSDFNEGCTIMTSLHYAVQGGHTDCVEKLIELGARVNTEDRYGNTPLLYACKYGHSDSIEALLKSGVIDVSKPNVQSVLNEAASHGYSDCVQKLLQFGLNVNNFDKDGNTPLVIASKKGFSNVVSELALSGNCNLNFMVANESMSSLQMWCAGNNHIILHTKLFLIKCDRKKSGGVTALHFAARHGHVDCTKTLIEYGADIHVEDEITKYTPLVWATMYGYENIINVCLTSNDEPVKIIRYVEIALIWAAIIGYERCLTVLCNYLAHSKLEVEPDEEHDKIIKDIISAEFGIEVWHVRENENMLLLLAAKNGNTAATETLLSLNYRNNEGLEEALFWASRNGHLDCVKLLINAGADEDKKNAKHFRLLPISWACMYGKTSVVKYLLSRKTSEYLQNNDFHIALNWAATGGHYECLKLLLDFGVDVDHFDPELDGTPLICACKYTGSAQVVGELIARNCNIQMKDGAGLTALDFSAEKKHFELVKELIVTGTFKGEVIEDQYKNLQFCLKWAVERGELELIEALIGLGIKHVEDDCK